MRIRVRLKKITFYGINYIFNLDKLFLQYQRYIAHHKKIINLKLKSNLDFLVLSHYFLYGKCLNLN